MEIVVTSPILSQEEKGAKNLKNAIKNVLWTCLGCGLKVEGKNPKEVKKEVDSGEWDALLKT